MPAQPSTLVAIVDHQLCDECGLCLPLCPPAAIGLRREGLVIDTITCTGCHKCIAPCPVGALSMVGRVQPFVMPVTSFVPLPAMPGPA